MRSIWILCALVGLWAAWRIEPQPQPQWSIAFEARRQALELETAKAPLESRESCARTPLEPAAPVERAGERAGERAQGRQSDWARLGSLLAQGKQYEAARLESEWLVDPTLADRALAHLQSGTASDELTNFGCVRLVVANLAREPQGLENVLLALPRVPLPAQQDLAQALAGLRRADGKEPLLGWQQLPLALRILREQPWQSERLELLFVHLGEARIPEHGEPLLLEIAHDPTLPATLVASARSALIARDPQLYGARFTADGSRPP